jgi:acyl carrier protein
VTHAAWDSLVHVTVIAAVEQSYGVQFTMAELLAIRGVGHLRRALEERGIAR